MRRLCLLALSCVLLAACGGSSSEDTTSTPRPRPTRTPGGPTRTPRPTDTPGGPTREPTRTRTPRPPQTIFVRTTGDDANPGTSPDQALKTIVAAADRLTPGSTIHVGPGHYRARVEITGVNGTAALPIRLIADTSGANTGERPGEVVLDGGADVVSLLVTRSPFVTVEGFLITGARPRENPEQSATAVHVRGGSTNFSLRHCLVANGTAADGIRIQASSDALVFNNLFFANDRGIVVNGDSPRARLINNTVVDHERTGIVFADNAGAAPTGGNVVNNIIELNGNGLGITVGDGPPSSLVGYSGNFNLVFEPEATDQATNYRPASIRGDRDVNQDAQFINLEQGDVRMLPTSPAVDAGNGAIDPTLLSELFDRTTAEDGARDRMPVDMGYHYPR